MFTKNHISMLVRCILFVAFIMGLLGLHPAQAVLAASKGGGMNAVTVQKGLATLDDLPDLIIQSITATPAHPTTKETVTFKVVIKIRARLIPVHFT